MKVLSLLACANLAFFQLPYSFPSSQGTFELEDRDILQANGRAYVLGSPTHVAGPGAFSLAWSPDGEQFGAVAMTFGPSHLLDTAMGRPPKHEFKVLRWKDGDVKTAQLDRGAMPSLIGWMGHGSLVYLSSRVLPSSPQRNEPQNETSLHIWGTAKSTSMRIPEDSMPVLSQKLEYGCTVNRSDAEGISCTVFGQNGPIKSMSINGVPAVDADGYIDYAVLELMRGTREAKLTWFRIMPDASIRPLRDAPKFPEDANDMRSISAAEVGYPVAPPSRPPAAQDPNALQAILTRTDPNNGPVKASVQSAWIWMPEKGKVKAALVAGEASDVMLSPNKRAIAYVTKNNLMVRQIQELQGSDLDKMLEEKEKRVLMQNAKQVGTAMLIYMTDYDDLLPPNAGWQDNVMPYLKNRGVMEGFFYDLDGQNGAKIDDPSKKRLGYIDGKYGRAIVYLDTHVIWEPRKRP